MRQGRFIATCAVLTLVFPAISSAQVVVDQQALEQLAGTRTTKPAPKPTQAARADKATPQPPKRVLYRNQPLRALPLPPPPAPLPATATIPPPPKAKRPPPKPPERAKPQKPCRIAITFAGTTAAPSPEVADEVQGFIGAKPAPRTRFLIQATAPGVSGDPSVARRLSLRRGLAVRDILRQSGIATDRIIVQALGNPPGVPTDRVTLTEIP